MNAWPFLVIDEEGDLRSIVYLPAKDDWNERKVAAEILKNPNLLQRIEYDLVLVTDQYNLAGKKLDFICVTKTEIEPVIIELKFQTRKTKVYDIGWDFDQLERYVEIWNATRASSARGYLVYPIPKLFHEQPAPFGLLWNIIAELEFDPFLTIQLTKARPMDTWQKGVAYSGDVFRPFLSEYHFSSLEAFDNLEKQTFLFGQLLFDEVTQRLVSDSFEKKWELQFHEMVAGFPPVTSRKRALELLEKHELDVLLAATHTYVNNRQFSLTRALQSRQSVELFYSAKRAMNQVNMVTSRIRYVESVQD